MQRLVTRCPFGGPRGQANRLTPAAALQIARCVACSPWYLSDFGITPSAATSRTVNRRAATLSCTNPADSTGRAAVAGQNPHAACGAYFFSVRIQVTSSLMSAVRHRGVGRHRDLAPDAGAAFLDLLRRASRRRPCRPCTWRRRRRTPGPTIFLSIAWQAAQPSFFIMRFGLAHCRARRARRRRRTARRPARVSEASFHRISGMGECDRGECRQVADRARMLPERATAACGGQPIDAARASTFRERGRPAAGRSCRGTPTRPRPPPGRAPLTSAGGRSRTPATVEHARRRPVARLRAPAATARSLSASPASSTAAGGASRSPSASSSVEQPPGDSRERRREQRARRARAAST